MTSEDTYYITVVAYNAAFQASEPVCSDGVTIDSSESSIKELSISNSRIKGGIVTNSGEFWIISDERTRKKIYNATSCRYISKSNEFTFKDWVTLGQIFERSHLFLPVLKPRPLQAWI
jgi:hypothetical protein